MVERIVVKLSKAAERPDRVLMPPCLGQYERGNVACNGAPTAKADSPERLPCMFRDRCVGFRCLLQDLEKVGREAKASKLVRLSIIANKSFCVARGNAKKLDVAITSRVVKYGIKDGLITSPKGDGLRGLQKKGRERSYEGATQMCEYFMEKIQRSTGKTIRDNPIACRPGDILLVDRFRKSNYGALYIMEGRKRHALCSIYPSRKVATAQVRLGISFEDWSSLGSGEERARFEATPLKGDGRFRVKIVSLDRGKLVALAYFIQKALESGLYGFSQ